MRKEDAKINVLVTFGRIIDWEKYEQVGEYVYDVTAKYVAYRMRDGKARRFEGNPEQFLASLPSWFDITEDVGTAMV